MCKAHGWEFVPCSMLDREGDRTRSRSPLRGLTSKASVAHITEQSGLGNTASPPADLQSQHLRLRKRFEELKKRHGHEKYAWMKEKEMLLREVADVQVMTCILIRRKQRNRSNKLCGWFIMMSDFLFLFFIFCRAERTDGYCWI